jgi:hypothetical protein
MIKSRREHSDHVRLFLGAYLIEEGHNNFGSVIVIERLGREVVSLPFTQNRLFQNEIPCIYFFIYA